MREFGPIIRRLAKNLAGLAFWLHALMIMPLPRPPVAEVAARLGLTFSEATLATFFVAMALLSCYGFQRFLLDCLYVYTFPFIVAYRLIVKAAKNGRQDTQIDRAFRARNPA